MNLYGIITAATIGFGEHEPSWFANFPGWSADYDHVWHVGFVFLLLTLFSILGGAAIKKNKGNLIPDAKFNLRNFVEIIVGSLYGFTRGQLGDHEGKRLFPFIGGLFIYIFVCNVLGILPGFNPPTTNLNTNLAMSVSVFVFYNILGLIAHGPGYIKHFMGPILALAPLMIVIELISHMVRPISLSLRLFGNMNGDHAVLAVFTDLTGLVIPSVFMVLGLFVSFIQAFVFTLLTIVYIQGSVSHDH
jgi:F-type H+-transporting ATPase subunit a